MKAVAYCRISTNKEEQAQSLISQQNFFKEYADLNNYDLIKTYADEGKSGTKIKNRKELISLLGDAEKKLFDIVLIKDISRLARNTVDFLTSIRKLRSLGVKVVFVNYDQTSSESSEFMLTMLSAIAQEESANTSKRVKFGKKINAEKGKVPNLVYGYDKIPGDYFNLYINEKEKNIVCEIFDMYVNENKGSGKIAAELNRRNISTKRGNTWTQASISRILSNQIYIGKIINGKEEVENFLTGVRKSKEKENWIIHDRPDLMIVEPEIFYKAQNIMLDRKEKFKLDMKRKSDKRVFSKIIICESCGSVFRRQERKYKNTYIRWVCSGRNQKGKKYCSNKVVVDERELIESIEKYFRDIVLKDLALVRKILKVITISKDRNKLNNELRRLIKRKEKYFEMYEADIIDLAELKEKSQIIKERVNLLNKSYLNFKNYTSESIEDLIENMDMEIIVSSFIEKITVDIEGNIEVYIKIL